MKGTCDTICLFIILGGDTFTYLLKVGKDKFPEKSVHQGKLHKKQKAYKGVIGSIAIEIIHIKCGCIQIQGYR